MIYYYHDENKPLLLLITYAKAQQASLSGAQKKDVKKMVGGLLDNFT